MGRSLVETRRSNAVKKRVYLPDVDEYRSSSRALNEVVLESIGSVSSARSKQLKEGYVADLTREAGVSPCSMILGLLYISRLNEANPRFLRTLSGKDMFLTSMIIASKYLNDEGESEALTNSEWALVGCRTKSAVDEMERQFLAAIDWKLYVPLEEYYSFVSGIEGRIALNQFVQRGWLTYTDMVALWDVMDTQKTLLTATKYVAKVTCGSAAVYLVLLSTLLTASHGLNSTSWIPSSPLSPSSPPSSSSTSSPSSNVSTTLQHQHLLGGIPRTDLRLRPTDFDVFAKLNRGNIEQLTCAPEREHSLQLGFNCTGGLSGNWCVEENIGLRSMAIGHLMGMWSGVQDVLDWWAPFAVKLESPQLFVENFETYGTHFGSGYPHRGGRGGRGRGGRVTKFETVYESWLLSVWSRNVYLWLKDGLDFCAAVFEGLTLEQNSTSCPQSIRTTCPRSIGRDCSDHAYVGLNTKVLPPGFLINTHLVVEAQIGPGWSRRLGAG